MAKILIAEDEEQIRTLIAEELVDCGHDVREAGDGEEGLEIAREFLPDLIISDIMMPKSGGFDFYRSLRAEPNQLQATPVVFLTALADKSDLLDGKVLGVDDYLTKPIDFDLLNATVEARLNSMNRRTSYMTDKLRGIYDQFYGQNIPADNPRYQSIDTFLDGYIKNIERISKVIPGGDHLVSSKYHFKTPEDVRNIASGVAGLCKNPDTVVIGLVELMMNAVEHGNLGLGYDAKTELLNNDQYFREIETRLQLDPYKDKYAKLKFERFENGRIELTIMDQGDGFNWQEYLDFSPSRMTHMHGRGIAIASTACFSSVHYQDSGNVVIATIE